MKDAHSQKQDKKPRQPTRKNTHGEILHRAEILNFQLNFFKKLKYNVIWSISHAKHTVVELATANKEEWHFLPRKWKNPTYRKQMFFVRQYGHEMSCFRNFMLFSFLPWYSYPKGTGDFLLLNLVTRKRFWLQSEKLHNQIRPRNLLSVAPIYGYGRFIDS